MRTGTVKTKGDQGMDANGAKLGTIERSRTESEKKVTYYFDNCNGFDVDNKVKWNKTAKLGSYLIALNVKDG